MENVEKIKNQIIAELGLLSYLEKKKVRDNLDGAFISKEIQNINKAKRTFKIFSFFWVLLSIAFITLFLFRLDYKNLEVINYYQLLIGFGYLILSVASIVKKVSLSKRESLYKILAVFSAVNSKRKLTIIPTKTDQTI